jgi:phospholipid/cholesterol/gamma-HCH transport system permease protein
MALTENDEARHFAIERVDRVVRLVGSLRIHDAAVIWRRLRDTAESIGPGEVAIDLSGVERIDGGILALIVAERAELVAHRVNATLVSTPAHLQPLVELYGRVSGPPPPPQREKVDIITRVGAIVLEGIARTRHFLGFVGELALACLELFRRPRMGHWKEVPELVVRTGADALPIIVPIMFLVGFVMGYQSARQLEQFGANVYVADLVSLSITRELGPLMTAIIIAGRSGAAFAAELGTMKVSDEIDALRTIGIKPIAWLVVPRISALVLVLPVLVLVADVVGVLGGLLVAVVSLNVPATAYLLEAERTLEPWDIEQGIVKSIPFAIAIALVACQQGFSAAGGTEGVGRRTTATVVINLFSLVMLDAAFTLVFRMIGK